MEEILPPQTENDSGFESPRICQFTIFLENKVGRLQMLLRGIEETVGPIVAMSIEESADSALVRLISSNPDECREMIHKEGFSFTESELLAVELPANNKHPLISICSALLAAEINIHYTYPLLTRPRGPAIAMYVDDPTLSARLLIKKGFVLLGESDLSNL